MLSGGFGEVKNKGTLGWVDGMGLCCEGEPSGDIDEVEGVSFTYIEHQTMST